jgi:hypothetical protein
MRIAALLVALSTIVISIGGLISPESGTEIRRLYFATPVRLYTAAAFRVAMGLVVILSATASRAPRTLRALGALMCMQGLSATLLGPEHARTVLEWEAGQGPALLRAGAAVALAAGGFMAFAVTGQRPKSGAKPN